MDKGIIFLLTALILHGILLAHACCNALNEAYKSNSASNTNESLLAEYAKTCGRIERYRAVETHLNKVQINFSMDFYYGGNEVSAFVGTNSVIIVVGQKVPFKTLCVPFKVTEDGWSDIHGSLLRYSKVMPIGFDDDLKRVDVYVGLGCERHITLEVQINWLEDRYLAMNRYVGNDASIRTYRILVKIYRFILGELHTQGVPYNCNGVSL